MVPAAQEVSWENFKERFRPSFIPGGLVQVMKDKFREFKQGSEAVYEYLEDFNELARYAPEDVDSDEKKRRQFMKGLHEELQPYLASVPYPNFKALVDAAINTENKRKAAFESRKRKAQMQSGGPSQQRSRSQPPVRLAPPPPRSHSAGPRPNNPNRGYSAPRPGGFGYAPRPAAPSCPAGGSSGCFLCGKPCHFARECPSKTNAAPRPNAQAQC